MLRIHYQVNVQRSLRYISGSIINKKLQSRNNEQQQQQQQKKYNYTTIQ